MSRKNEIYKNTPLIEMVFAAVNRDGHLFSLKKKEEAPKRQDTKGIDTFRPKNCYRTEFRRALQKTIKNEFIY